MNPFRSRSMILGAMALLCACATDVPASTAFADSAGRVVIDVAGDGFVRCDGRRLPLEAAVLELRQRTRALPREDLLSRFVVRLRADPQEPDSEAAKRAQESMDRLFMELEIMDVKQLEYL